MARDPQQLRKTYESKLGKDLVAKLTDQQINIISKFYNSLGKEEQSEIDNKIFKGYNDSELHEMAKSFVEENSEDTKKYEPADKFIDDTQERLDGELKGTSDGILSEIDKLIAEYQGKVDSVKKSSTKLKENVKEKSSALAVIVGNVPQKEEELVDEDIDSRILELLGIEDTTGLDYSDYKSLLKEKMAADRMNDNEGDSGDAELISDEYKRIKGSTGKFKVNSKKINVQSFVAKTKPSSSAVSVTPLLPSVTPQETEQPIQPERQGMDETLALIASKLNSVDKNVQQTTSNLQNKDAAENAQKNQDRLTAENTAAQRKEERIERAAVLGGALAGMKKTVKPLTDMMSGLFDFFQRLGFAMFIMELMKFLKDPAKYINGIIGWINKQIVKLETSIENFVIDKMVKPMNGMIKGLNSKIKDFVGIINPLLEKLSLLGIKPIDSNSLKIPEIKESDIRDGVNLPEISNVDKDFLNFGQVDDSGESNKSESTPQETLMGGNRSQSTSSGSASKSSSDNGSAAGDSGGAMTMGSDFDSTFAKLLKSYEGLKTEAYLDAVGIPTIGMGATYYPKGFRLSGRVQMGQTITEEEALFIKKAHIKEHRDRLLRELPSSTYNKVPDNVKAALESKVFNYGSLGSTLTNLVTTATKDDNYKPVSDYFRNSLAKHDGGINSWRRNDEADIIDTGRSSRAGLSFRKKSGSKATEAYKAKVTKASSGSGVPESNTPGVDMTTGGGTSPLSTSSEPPPIGQKREPPTPTEEQKTKMLQGSGMPALAPNQSFKSNITPPVQKASLTTIGGLSGGKVPGTTLAAAGGIQSQAYSFSATNGADLSVLSTKETLRVVGT